MCSLAVLDIDVRRWFLGSSDADACGLLRLFCAMRWGQGQSQNNADFTTQTWGGRAATPLKRVAVSLARIETGTR